MPRLLRSKSRYRLRFKYARPVRLLRLLYDGLPVRRDFTVRWTSSTSPQWDDGLAVRGISTDRMSVVRRNRQDRFPVVEVSSVRPLSEQAESHSRCCALSFSISLVQTRIILAGGPERFPRIRHLTNIAFVNFLRECRCGLTKRDEYPMLVNS